MVPAWVQKRHSENLARMETTPISHPDSVFCSVLAFCGPESVDVHADSYTLNLQAHDYGPVMLAGMNMIAGSAMQALLCLWYAQMKDSEDLESLDEDERCEAMRVSFDSALRQWMKEELLLAGQEFQKKVMLDEIFGEPDGLIVRSISQVVAAWIKLTEAKIMFGSEEPE